LWWGCCLWFGLGFGGVCFGGLGLGGGWFWVGLCLGCGGFGLGCCGWGWWCCWCAGLCLSFWCCCGWGWCGFVGWVGVFGWGCGGLCWVLGGLGLCWGGW
ncbi:hypothetical protein RA267_27925, partial [Pseudomonas syringae pv. tagetis]|uniref:hypothetical protein n=1 Tax=Pseudomonas syringae group genomosp. 7 TaxID=251699 RepID=UPI00376F84E3